MVQGRDERIIDKARAIGTVLMTVVAIGIGGASGDATRGAHGGANLIDVNARAAHRARHLGVQHACPSGGHGRKACVMRERDGECGRVVVERNASGDARTAIGTSAQRVAHVAAILECGAPCGGERLTYARSVAQQGQLQRFCERHAMAERH